VAQLLVSVRSADEARTALAGGASIIDVKEPDHGSPGQAPWSVWRDVHTVVSTAAPISSELIASIRSIVLVQPWIQGY
jgi:uncharacterized protein (UPF0264 family)